MRTSCRGFFEGETKKRARGISLFVFAALFCLLTGCRERIPVIASIDPRIGHMGELLTIYGENFGEVQEESYITIAGAPPTASSYITWEDQKITLTVPEFAEPGLVYVHKDGRKSNPALFANRAAMPEPLKGDELLNSPRVTSIEPKSAAIGALISIQGSNFGSSRDNSGVRFTWDAESAPTAPVEHRPDDGVEVFEADFGYDFWSEREIRIRVPDGAVSGNIEVRTPRGSSAPVFFEITNRPGTKTFRDKRSYSISFSVDIRVDAATVPNALYLWMPRPVSSASQRGIELLSRNVEPYIENHRGTTLYRLSDLAPQLSRQIKLSYVLDVYSVETTMRPASIRTESSPLQSVYTMPAALIPSDDAKITAQSAAIIGRERNPYNRAKLIYEWILNNLDVQAESLGSGGAVEALDEKTADCYRASLLFCALARAAGIPAVPVSGVLVNRQRVATRHYWAEFWIDSFGWVPVDPLLGSGAAPSDFNLRDDHRLYYFGNSDNLRIAFSRGQNALSQMDPRGRIVGRTREYAMQNLWEEAVGGLESYSSLWSDVTITGMYAQ